MADQKYTTSQLYAASESLRPLLLNIEGYIKLSKTLKANAEDFKISKLRNEITKKNFEGVRHYMNILLQMLVNNSSDLADEGLPDDTIAKLNTLLETIDTNDLKQQQKMSEHNVLVDDNLEIFNELWEQMNAIMDIGKRIYKYGQTAKLDDYTMETLKSRVNRHRSPQVQETSAG